MRNVPHSVRLLGWIALAATLPLAGCGGWDSASSAGTASSASAAATQPAQKPVTQRPAPVGNPAPSPTPAPSPAPTQPPPPPPTTSSSSATLSWLAPTQNTNGSALTNLGGFRIYYGTDPARLTSKITLSSPGLLTYVIEGLTVGTTYYFAVTAVTSGGVEGVASAVVSKRIS
jgi:Fibronectin type III domain